LSSFYLLSRSVQQFLPDDKPFLMRYVRQILPLFFVFVTISLLMSLLLFLSFVFEISLISFRNISGDYSLLSPHSFVSLSSRKGTPPPPPPTSRALVFHQSLAFFSPPFLFTRHSPGYASETVGFSFHPKAVRELCSFSI